MLKVTRQTDYGVLLLAHFASGEGALTARAVAERTGVTPAMSSKILKLLVQQGLLTSQQGVKGGYSLARRADEITVADIVEALEGPIAVTACSDSSSSCEHESWCPCRPNWQKINEAIRGALESITLSAMAESLPGSGLAAPVLAKQED